VYIFVVQVYWDFSSEKVLTMEFVPGIKINNIAEIEKRGIDRKLLAKRSAEAFLTQLCRY
jgi:ubiquinone biosynthesis protein